MSITTITAADGKWLTQTADVPIEERIMVREVSGFGDLASLYREATDTEYAEYLAFQDSSLVRFDQQDPTIELQ